MPAFDPVGFDPSFDIGAGAGTLPFIVGFDPFDSLMNKICDILENQGAVDGYGHQPNQVQDFVVIATVPCRISINAIGRPHEYLVEKESSTNYQTVFMRPPVLPGGVDLTPHHWLRIEGNFYNIFSIDDPSALGHHLQVVIKQVIP